MTDETVFENTSGEGGASALAADHLDAMPEPQEHAIAAERDDEQAAAQKVDEHGTPFDPEQHIDSLTKTGRWRKKPGRKRGQTASTLNTGSDDSARAQFSGHDDSGDVGAYSSAVATVDSLGVVATMLGGEAYQYQVVMDPADKNRVLMDERENGVDAFYKLYREKGVKDIPPGAAVVLWGIMFLAPRLRQDKRATNKLKSAWYWLLAKFGRKSTQRGTENGARADHRDDRVR